MIQTGNWEAPEGGVNENTGIWKRKKGCETDEYAYMKTRKKNWGMRYSGKTSSGGKDREGSGSSYLV